MTQNLPSLDELEDLVSQLEESLKISDKTEKLKRLQAESTAQDFWDNETHAKSIMQKISSFQDDINQISTAKTKISDLKELNELVSSGDDKSVDADLAQELNQLAKQLDKLKIRSYLSGEHDTKPAIVSIHSGQGGTEAMDWAAMLMRMYMRYFEKSQFDFQLIEQTSGEEAGIKSATIVVKGDFAYGYLKAEAGTHRLVRLSPFNSDNLRQTSFALVEVLPLIEKKTSTIKDEELDWQFFKSGGAGGQNVNKVNTAVRVKHLPTGIVVTASSQRTQLQNRNTALGILESKLEQLEQAKQDQAQDELKGDNRIGGWGHQIRSYVLHPYQMVKDLRTQVETSNTDGVLDGDIQEFIEAGVTLEV